MRKLASIQKIDRLEVIEKADFIEKAKVLGWTLVVKKGEFKEGDLCIYHEIDSLLPDHEVYAFMKGPSGSLKNLRLRTKKMRGVISQGLALPVKTLAKFGHNPYSFSLGDDVTELLEIVKYEAENLPKGERIKGSFPFYVPKTDESRIQSNPEILENIQGKRCYITVKLDGCSGTFCRKDGEIDICSRNLSLKDSGSKKDYWWEVARKYQISEKLEKLGNFALQGEICGPSIQKNRLGLEELQLFLFDIYDIDQQQYLDLENLKKTARELGIPVVPIIDDNFIPDENISVESLLKMAEGKYEGTKNEREGIVIRTMSDPKERISFKIISNRFLLKSKDQDE